MGCLSQRQNNISKRSSTGYRLYSGRTMFKLYRHHARRIIASLSKQILQLYTGLYRAWFSALVQIQTGKIALGVYLGIIGVIDIICPCRWGPQSVKYILMEYPRYEKFCWSLLWAKRRFTDFRQALNRPPELVKQIIKYILHTGLLGQFRNFNIYILDKAPGAQYWLFGQFRNIYCFNLLYRDPDI